jgi:hypothetical protein
MNTVTYHISRDHEIYNWLVSEIFYAEILRLNRGNKIKYIIKNYGTRAKKRYEDVQRLAYTN